MDRDLEKKLGAFMKQCEFLVATGQAYLAVILCHEYFRFLFPVEPYENFTNNDPYRFTLKKIDELTRLAKAWSVAVKPYKKFDPTDLTINTSKTLESKTSALYSGLWSRFDEKTIWDESVRLLKKRLPREWIARSVKGKKVLDMGCGSGRYTIALARLGAREVVGTDLSKRSYGVAQRLAKKKCLPIRFVEANFHRLPFKDGAFDLVFCNGTLHHSSSIKKGLKELYRVLAPGGASFLYLYADGGVFWYSRRKMRELFQKIPAAYTDHVLKMIGLPGHRFIFQDVWYVPVETHTSRKALEKMLRACGFRFHKLNSTNSFDLDRAIAAHIKDAVKMWGDGEHRYELRK